ncbi:hypothetical protein NQ314_002122 [Rhamnusium bicolor]|uniref:G-protein coupled receptors family 1 profile domain-containing protein n=1 Tax=Rhamnusium bicolor TaxID=1586634 RepID=A0AAV8ZQ83_9CUCU|nr:hypothetical protein NQ314_002122 [Rhamnusium bicolor]
MQITSIWLTVSFTVERYIAVCHPIKGKYFCTERRAKSMIVIVYIFCILTTASTKFEYQLSLNETCIEECKLDTNIPQKIGKSHHNGSTHHYSPDHTIMHNTKFSFENPYPGLNDAYFSQLKQIILSNCTSHPCIICIPHFPQLNMTKEKKY